MGEIWLGGEAGIGIARLRGISQVSWLPRPLRGP
jgi:hypothetical protein